MIKNITPEDFGTLAICAIRYCHGRQTYMPDLVRGIVRQHGKHAYNYDFCPNCGADMRGEQDETN